MYARMLAYMQKPKVITWAIVIIAALVALWFLPKLLRSTFADLAKDAAEGKAGTFENEMANRYYTAGHSGWWGATEDETELMKLASQSQGMTGFSKIARRYKELYAKSLESELSNWLDSNELSAFYNKLRK